MSTAGLLLDRDGVIVEDIGYLHRPEDIVMIPGAAATLAALTAIGVPLAVVSNQSGVGRGLFGEDAVQRVNDEIGRQLRLAGAICERFYFCAEHPVHGIGRYRRDTGRRKPAPGMLLEAAADLGLDLARSIMLGDQLSDIEAGRLAGCRTVLVRTGKGKNTEAAAAPVWDAAFDDLGAAGAFLLNHFREAARGGR